ncbi:MAG TPA: response regulator [Allosphingosinicella sp.]|nr:response regulator [Allosphingosinicella sp.]
MSLAGVRVLLVEDEAIIAMTAEDMLDELGCTTVATASSLAEAIAATEPADFDVALLDINLNGLDSLPVADRLLEAGKPFVFTTGYGAAGRGGCHADAPLVTKPYQLQDLETAIREALRR